MNNTLFEKNMKNIRKHRDIKLFTNEIRRNDLVTEPNCHTRKKFSENLLAIKMKKQIFMNKLVYLSLSVLEISKTVMYEFWYDNVNPKYGECYITKNVRIYIT